MCVFFSLYLCFCVGERKCETWDGYMSLSSLTRLAVSWKESSVGEYMLDFSRFTGFEGGITGGGWLGVVFSVPKADCLSCI